MARLSVRAAGGSSDVAALVTIIQSLALTANSSDRISRSTSSSGIPLRQHRRSRGVEPDPESPLGGVGATGTPSAAPSSQSDQRGALPETVRAERSLSYPPAIECLREPIRRRTLPAPGLQGLSPSFPRDIRSSAGFPHYDSVGFPHQRTPVFSAGFPHQCRWGFPHRFSVFARPLSSSSLAGFHLRFVNAPDPFPFVGWLAVNGVHIG